MLVLEKRRDRLTITTRVFNAYDCGILEAIEYILQDNDFTKKDKLYLVNSLITKLGKEIYSSKDPKISYKFYYLP